MNDGIEIKRMFAGAAHIHKAIREIEDVPDILRASGMSDLARAMESASKSMEKTCDTLESRIEELRNRTVGA